MACFRYTHWIGLGGTITTNDTVPSASGRLGAGSAECDCEAHGCGLFLLEMPSLCVTQQDRVIASDASETTLKQCLTIVEKKVRNLEKRKVRFGCFDITGCLFCFDMCATGIATLRWRQKTKTFRNCGNVKPNVKISAGYDFTVHFMTPSRLLCNCGLFQ